MADCFAKFGVRLPADCNGDECTTCTTDIGRFFRAKIEDCLLAGIKPAALAKMMGVTPMTLFSWRARATDPSYTQMRVLIPLLDCEIVEHLKTEGDQQIYSMKKIAARRRRKR